MNSRPLTKDEGSVLGALRLAASEYALMYLTETGLSKSILDATEPVRSFLRESGFHDYSSQSQGQVFKRLLDFGLLLPDEEISITASMYRPQTKKGDPRIWFLGARKYFRPNDVICLLVIGGKLYLANISSLVRVGFMPGGQSWLANWIQRETANEQQVALELLGKLREMRENGPFYAEGSYDTSVGRHLEHLLGINMNSNQAPDYKGIEIKTKRAGSQNTRSTLFAQVPNWSLSNLKSSREILEHFGYHRDGAFRLYCTVSAVKPNSQGLALKVLDDPGLLVEYAKRFGDVVIWQLSTLHERLLSKHPETFWIEVETERKRPREMFNIARVVHTRKPSVAQFDAFLADGTITVDHLIKEVEGRANAKEKGPFFKILPKYRDRLFIAPTQLYELGLG